jgi:ferredoxin
MCEFCHTHGEGKKWYLEAKNYSDDLLSDLRRRDFIKDFFEKPEVQSEGVEKIGKLASAPGFVKSALATRISDKMKKLHFGQVVPIEEVERIFDFVTSITRFACLCRHLTVGSEQRYCYGVSLAPNGGKMVELIREIDPTYLIGPDTDGMESFSKEKALSMLREHEEEGLCHTVWTFVAPFIAGICNCDKADCLAMQSTVTYGVSQLFRAEYVAEVAPDLCTGCRDCMRSCQFGAISYSAALEKTVIDLRRCYGCGICRAACPSGAIELKERAAVPAAAKLW